MAVKKISKMVPTESLTIGAFLRQARETKGLTQKEAAYLLGHSSAQFIYNIEHELCMVPKKHIAALAKAYGISDKDIRIQLVRYLTSSIKVKYGFKP